MTSPTTPLTPARLDWQQDVPVALDYDDPYFSREDGMAESDYVFLQGNQLQARFQSLPEHHYLLVAETGFGTGLNCLQAAQLFLQQAPNSCRLHLVSVEKHPLSRADLQRALAQWPALEPLSKALLAQYPAPYPGQHRLRLHPRIDLTLLYGDAVQQWQLWHHPVDAWMLDGFAPARNPDMWQPALFQQMARLSRPGTTLATFTAAGLVRRGLQGEGFTIDKIPGFGRKRHMLVGHFAADLPAAAARPIRTGQALVVGAGLAGATTARALAERGWHVTVLDPNGIAQGASGNLAGVVYSSPSPHLTAQNRFYLHSYAHALRWLDHYRYPDNQHGQLNGVIQHYVSERQQHKYQQAMASGSWPAQLLEARDAQSAELKGGGYLQPGTWCQQLLDHPNIDWLGQRVTTLQAGSPVRATLDNGQQLEAQVAVLCAAGDSRALPGLDWLPLKPIRGQVSYCRATPESHHWQQAHCHGGYLTPALDGLHCVGATFDLHHLDPAPRDQDDQANLAQLKQHLPEYWQQLGGEHIEVVQRRVAFRCQSSDFLPLCGPWPDPASDPLQPVANLYLNLAHGSRGITGTPLCADLLADLISGLPPALDSELAAALNPARFILRKRRKKQ